MGARRILSIFFQDLKLATLKLRQHVLWLLNRSPY